MIKKYCLTVHQILPLYDIILITSEVVMSDYNTYSKVLTKSVSHIFKNFLKDSGIEEVYETQSSENDPHVAVEINGSLEGEIVINIPQSTLTQISKCFTGDSRKRITKSVSADVAGELANLITGTFANLMQYAEHDILLAPPEFNDDPIQIKTLYENVNISFNSSFGGFDIDLYYR